MNPEAQDVVVITDTSVLVNFLCINRMDLIARHSYHFMITEHVIEEITDHYPDQQSRLNAALVDGTLQVTKVSGDTALQLFRILAGTGRLGIGESAAIAWAISNNSPIAIDDRRAVSEMRHLKSDLVVLGTQEIMIDLIRSGIIDVAEANEVKETWANHYRFRLAISSFAELL